MRCPNSSSSQGVGNSESLRGIFKSILPQVAPVGSTGALTLNELN